MAYSINTALVLETINNSEKSVYKARIADIKEQDIFIEMPMNEATKRIEAPAIGTELRVWFQAPDNSKASFDTTVTGRVKENIAMLIIAKPDPKSIYKKQRRDFIRVPAIIEVAVVVQTKEADIKIIAKTEDISGGGFSVRYDSNIIINETQKGRAWLVMPKKNETISHAYGEVDIVKVKYPDNPLNKAWASFKFTHITEGERSKVVQYTFEKQIDFYGR